MKKYISPGITMIRLKPESSILSTSGRIPVSGDKDDYDAGDSYANRKEDFWGGTDWE